MCDVNVFTLTLHQMFEWVRRAIREVMAKARTWCMTSGMPIPGPWLNCCIFSTPRVTSALFVLKNIYYYNLHDLFTILSLWRQTSIILIIIPHEIYLLYSLMWSQRAIILFIYCLMAMSHLCAQCHPPMIFFLFNTLWHQKAIIYTVLWQCHTHMCNIVLWCCIGVHTWHDQCR